MTASVTTAPDARAVLAARGIVCVERWIDGADLEAAAAFMRAHDFEEAWRHSPRGGAIERRLRELLDGVLGFHHLAPCRTEKIKGHTDISHAHELLTWHRSEYPQRTNLDLMNDRRTLVAAVLFRDRRGGDSTFEVLAGSDDEETPRFQTSPVRLTGAQGAVWLFSAYAWRRQVPRDFTQLVPDALWTPRTRAFDDRVRKALLLRARRYSLGPKATTLLRPPTTLDVALSLGIEGRDQRVRR